MNVDTKKSSTHVVIMRLLGELAAKAGATDLPLHVRSINENFSSQNRIFAHLTSSTLTHAGLAVRNLYGK